MRIANGPMGRVNERMLRERRRCERERKGERASDRAQHYMLQRAARQRRCHEDFDDVDDVDDEEHNDADDAKHDADAVADDGADDDAPAYLALPLQLQSVRKPEAVRRLCLGQRCVPFEQTPRCNKNNKKTKKQQQLRKETKTSNARINKRYIKSAKIVEE